MNLLNDSTPCSTKDTQRVVGVSYVQSMTHEGWSSKADATKSGGLAPLLIRPPCVRWQNNQTTLDFSTQFKRIWFTPIFDMRKLEEQNKTLGTDPNRASQGDISFTFNNQETKQSIILPELDNCATLPDVTPRLRAQRCFHTVVFNLHQYSVTESSALIRRYALTNVATRLALVDKYNGRRELCWDLDDLFVDRLVQKAQAAVFLVHFRFNALVGLQTFARECDIATLLRESNVQLMLRFMPSNCYLTKQQQARNRRITARRKSRGTTTITWLQQYYSELATNISDPRAPQIHTRREPSRKRQRIISPDTQRIIDLSVSEMTEHPTKRCNVRTELLIDEELFLNKLKPAHHALLNSIIQSFGTYVAINLKRVEYEDCPFYPIHTRDSFCDPLHSLSTGLRVQKREFTRTDYYLRHSDRPSRRYLKWLATRDHRIKEQHHRDTGRQHSEYDKQWRPERDGLVHDCTIKGRKCLWLGATAYPDLFRDEEIHSIEDSLDRLQKRSEKRQDERTSQHTCRSGIIVRTKHFYGARYLWHPSQLRAEGRQKSIGAGLRVDVDAKPEELIRLVEAPLIKYGIIPPDWVQGIAFNMYVDGSEGLGPHMDCIRRFQRPIVSLRLFSDARIAFGCDLYGTSNGAFAIPLPRGCVFVLEQNSFAANGIKHTIRACDLYAKSAAVMLRRFQQDKLHEAQMLQKKRIDE